MVDLTIINLIENHVVNSGFKVRTYSNKISILDINGIAIYQIKIEYKNNDILAHIVSVSKSKPKRKHHFSSSFIYHSQNKKLFTVELHDSASIIKIDEWLKEIQSKLK